MPTDTVVLLDHRRRSFTHKSLENIKSMFTAEGLKETKNFQKIQFLPIITKEEQGGI